MRTPLAISCAVLLFCACAQNKTSGFVGPTSRTQLDTVTVSERARIVEAVVSFRQLVFWNDTTTRFDGCSVALALAPRDQPLLRADVRRAISPPSGCVNTGSEIMRSPTLILGPIRGGDDEVTVQVTYRGPGTHPHEEEYKVMRSSSRSSSPWVATEVRIYGVLIVD